MDLQGQFQAQARWPHRGRIPTAKTTVLLKLLRVTGPRDTASLICAKWGQSLCLLGLRFLVHKIRELDKTSHLPPGTLRNMNTLELQSRDGKNVGLHCHLQRAGIHELPGGWRGLRQLVKAQGESQEPQHCAEVAGRMQGIPTESSRFWNSDSEWFSDMWRSRRTWTDNTSSMSLYYLSPVLSSCTLLHLVSRRS